MLLAPLCMCWFCTIACFCICCASHLLILSYQVYLCMLVGTPCICVLVLSLYLNIFVILFGSCEKLMDYPILGEWCVFWAFHNPKICIHEGYHLLLILQDYLVSIWYFILMRISNSIMSINCIMLDLFASC